jgi:hypothetical protein
MLRQLGGLSLGMILVAACTAAGTSPATSGPATPAALPSAAHSDVKRALSRSVVGEVGVEPTRRLRGTGS